MAVMKGVDGSVTFSTGYTTKVRSWTLNIEAEDVDTSALGEVWATRITGLKRWSGSYTALVDDGMFTATINGTTDPTLGTLEFGTTAASATFAFGSGTGDAFEGDIVVTGIEMGVETEGGASEVTFTFGGSGELNVA